MNFKRAIFGFIILSIPFFGVACSSNNNQKATEEALKSSQIQNEKNDISENNETVENEDDNQDEEKLAETNDIISGKDWNNGTSLISLNSDGTFKWYRDEAVLDNYYYSGTYAVYNGEDAIDYISNNLTEYGVTEEEQNNFVNAGYNNINDYYCLILDNEEQIIDGKNQHQENLITPYFGFYRKEKNVLELASMNTGNKIEFVEKIEQE